MFGLTLEKLIIIGLIAAVVVGPSRLPHYAHSLGSLVRAFRDFLQSVKTQTESELGTPLEIDKWTTHLQHYDPRQITKAALSTDASVPTSSDHARHPER
ncbi:MAG: twin-arginine translocase TatA/TatE family subunit [Rhodococcus sp.]|nr:twin-arginine translocase TatA/TatE family subunit [Rhodococcus sp. (in: high G+C Gram-positive bacteria)]